MPGANAGIEEVDVEGEEDWAPADALSYRPEAKSLASEIAKLIRRDHSEAETFGDGKIIGR